MELIINNNTYILVNDNILKLEYFRKIYENEKNGDGLNPSATRIIFPDILYDQICHFITNKYLEEHMKLKIYMVLSFLCKDDIKSHISNYIIILTRSLSLWSDL